MTESKRRAFGWFLAAVFAVAMLMGPGPGLLLVNRAETSVFGLPLLYAWGIGWFFVQMAVVLAAYWFVWKSDD